MSALEIKPGKYRTRNGEVATVRRDQFYLNGFVGNVCGKHCSWHTDGRASMYSETGADLIERIEDEPKYGAPIAPAFPFMPVSVGLDVAATGKDQTCVVTGAIDHRALEASKLHEFTLDVVSLAWRARVSELEAKIARLEAENESLSRQLRSRAINAEPASSGKVWRWSPLV